MNLRTSYRFLAVLALSLLLLVAVGQAQAVGESTVTMAAANEPVAVVATGALNVRSGPGMVYYRVATVYQGQVVVLLGRHATNGWVKIRLYSGMEGWVNSKYLQANVPINDLPVLAGTVPPSTGNTAVVASGALNVRSGPGAGYGVVTVVTWGQTLQLIGRNASVSWVKVTAPNGSVGWVNASLVYSNVPLYTLPVVDGSTDGGTTTATGVVVTGALNIRSGPGAHYNTVAVVGWGYQLTLTGRNAEGTWVQVRLANGTIGWANASYIQASVSIHTLPVVGAPAPSYGAVVSVGALNVRYGPDSTYGSFAVIFRGQTMTLLGRNAASSWLMIRLPSGTVGWVRSIYVVGNVPVHTLPITG